MAVWLVHASRGNGEDMAGRGGTRFGQYISEQLLPPMRETEKDDELMIGYLRILGQHTRH